MITYSFHRSSFVLVCLQGRARAPMQGAEGRGKARGPAGPWRGGGRGGPRALWGPGAAEPEGTRALQRLCAALGSFRPFGALLKSLGFCSFGARPALLQVCAPTGTQQTAPTAHPEETAAYLKRSPVCCPCLARAPAALWLRAPGCPPPPRAGLCTLYIRFWKSSTKCAQNCSGAPQGCPGNLGPRVAPQKGGCPQKAPKGFQKKPPNGPKLLNEKGGKWGERQI